MADGVSEQASKPSNFSDAWAALCANPLLVVGGIAWWACHYALLWNADIAVSYSAQNSFDIRFLLTILTTVVALGVMTALAKHDERLVYADRLYPYVAYAACTVVAYGLMAIFPLTDEAFWAGCVGAIMSGAGNSFMLVIYGELHARMGYRVEPLAFAIEVAGGIAVYFILSLAPLPIEVVAAMVLAVLASALFRLYARCHTSDDSLPPYDEKPTKVDMTIRQLVVLSILAGFAYGLMRAYGASGVDFEVVRFDMGSECLGSCVGAALLIVVFALRERQTLFEQCLLFVVPLIATGMLLISLQAVGSFAPTAINTGGFACFFNLMWYFAAVLACSKRSANLTFLVALLFFSSQTGQLLGVLVPDRFVNAFSSGFMYLLLLACVLFMYVRSKGVRASASDMDDESIHLPSVGVETSDIHECIDIFESRFELSPREAEVAALLIQRIPYRQIADRLFVSENTVKTHARNIYKKTGVSSREELLEELEDLAKKV